MAKIEHYYTQFEADNFYHVYNRSVDRKPMFKNTGNYKFFLQQYDKYLSPVLETYCYCLLGNHFHLLVRINNLQCLHNLQHQQSQQPHQPQDLTTFKKLSNLPTMPTMPTMPTIPTTPTTPTIPKTAHEIVSHQFRKFFQSYAMAFNKQHSRIGTLFQTPFKRALISDVNYFMNLVYYIHFNPQKHGLIADYKQWQWSSFDSIVSDKKTKINRQQVTDWFGNTINYRNYHNQALPDNLDEHIFIDEFD